MTDYTQIAKHYEECLEKFGPNNPKGMDWPNMEGMITRYKVMADLVKTDQACTLLDVGCGTGIFKHYLQIHRPNIYYTGIDINPKFIEICKTKYPTANFQQFDVLDNTFKTFFCRQDYAVINGIFTVKDKLSQEEMMDFFRRMAGTIFERVNIGIALNVMSKNVSWERDDLFHVPFDTLSSFIVNELKTRNFIFRNDYGLYEYTAYIYK